MSVPNVTKSTNRIADDWRLIAMERLMESPLSALGASLLQDLILMGVSKTLEPGQTYQQRDDVVEHVAVVMAGHLRIFRLSPAGKVHVLRSIGTGQLLNLLPVLDGGPAINDVDAVDKTELLLLPKAPFLSLMDENVNFRNAVNKVIYMRNRIAYDELADMVLLTLRQRCARVLMSMIHLQHAVEGIPRSTTLAVSQTELSDILGYSRPKVNLELMALKRNGVIEVRYNQIHIPDIALLKRAAKS
jgi:CRP/FNR family cyclic AMP-dependent transcriptional regulator